MQEAIKTTKDIQLLNEMIIIQIKFLLDIENIRLLRSQKNRKEDGPKCSFLKTNRNTVFNNLKSKVFQVKMSRTIYQAQIKGQLTNHYLIRSSSIASASNFTGSLLPSNEAAFFTINRNVQTCALRQFRPQLHSYILVQLK